MIWRNTHHRYGTVQLTLHWLTALMVAILIPLGLWMTGLDYYDPWYRKAPDLHRSIGVLLTGLLVLRLYWRISQLQPDPAGGAAWQRTAAIATHRLLYLVPFLSAISGYLISTADGRSVDVFGWFEIPATLTGIERQEDIAGDIHFALAMLLLGLVVTHVTAALHHHFVMRDGLLWRMFPFRNQEAQKGEN